MTTARNTIVRGAALALPFVFASFGSTVLAGTKPQKTDSTLSLRSPAFASMQAIPKEYTCDGREISPPLEWSSVPSGTKSLVVIIDDPDAPDPAAPQRVWVHWVLYDIAPLTTKLAAGAASAGLPTGTKIGKNDWGKAAYGGPCPPKGRHRYFHKLYALDTVLDFSSSPAKAEVESAMKGHVLAHAELIGTYEKAR